YREPLRAGTSRGYGTERQGVELALNSKILWQSLIDRGVAPRKSFDGHPTPVVHKWWSFAYFRGYFDGNGWAWASPANGRVEIGACGRPTMMRWCREELATRVGVGNVSIRPIRGCAQIRYAARADVAAIARWMYGLRNGGTGRPCLERKRDVLTRFLVAGE